MEVKTLTKFGEVDDFKVQGDPKAEKVILQVNNENHAMELVLDPNTVALLIEKLLKLLLIAPSKKISDLVQIVGIQSISAQMPYPDVPTLKYALELGIEMEKTIEPEFVRKLHKELEQIVLFLDQNRALNAH